MAVHGVGLAGMGGPARSGIPAAWLPDGPARTGVLNPANRPVEWEPPLKQLQRLVDKVSAGGLGCIKYVQLVHQVQYRMR